MTKYVRRNHGDALQIVSFVTAPVASAVVEAEGQESSPQSPWTPSVSTPDADHQCRCCFASASEQPTDASGPFHLRVLEAFASSATARQYRPRASSGAGRTQHDRQNDEQEPHHCGEVQSHVEPVRQPTIARIGDDEQHDGARHDLRADVRDEGFFGRPGITSFSPTASSHWIHRRRPPRVSGRPEA